MQAQLERRRERALFEAPKIANLGEEPIFSTFLVRSPSLREYRVTIRDLRTLDLCTCPDFLTNGLHCCKHVLAVRAHLARSHDIDDARPATSHVVGRGGKIELVRARDVPEETARVLARHFEGDVLRDVENLRDIVGLPGLEVGADAWQVAHAQAESKRAEVLRRDVADGVTFPVAFPLYEWQRMGAAFLATRGRAVLADDMGLGKTIQAIAAAELLRSRGELQRVLVVCPASIKVQWSREVGRATGTNGLVLEGPSLVRASLYARRAPYTIGTWDMLGRDLEAIEELAPDLIVFDEAQRVKNWRTNASRNAKRIASRFAFVLTGTPLENKLDDLYSIMQLVDQTLLGPLFKFNERYFRFNEKKRVSGWRNLQDLRSRTRPVVLRRRREDVLHELPVRKDHTSLVCLTDVQERAHFGQLQLAGMIMKKADERGFLTDVELKQLSMALTNARRICNSIALFNPRLEKQWRSPKLEELARVLEELVVATGEKAVVFTEWRDSQALVARILDELGLGHVVFSGHVPVKQRPALLEKFESDPRCRVLLSTDVGGVGLNLQFAGVVVNVDQPWNPAKVDQRVGRVQRLGQKRREVQVAHVFASGSIEERIVSLQSMKRSLASASLDDNSDVSDLQRDLRSLALVKKLLAELEPTRVGEVPQPRVRDEEPEIPDGKLPEASPRDERIVLAKRLREDPRFVIVAGRCQETPVVAVDGVTKMRAALAEEVNARSRDRGTVELERAREKVDAARCLVESGFAGEALARACEALVGGLRGVALTESADAPSDLEALVRTLASRGFDRELSRARAALELRDRLGTGRGVEEGIAREAIGDASALLDRASQLVRVAA